MRYQKIITDLMGTIITLTIEHEKGQYLLEKAHQMLINYNKIFSANNQASILMKINRNAGKKEVKVDKEMLEIIKYAKEVSIASDLALNIAVGPIIKLWKIGFKDANVPNKKDIKTRLNLINPENIIVDNINSTIFLQKEGMEIDLGGFVKGYFADELKKFFVKNGVKSGIINLGGNVLTIGQNNEVDHKKWTVGIQNPKKERGDFLAAIFIEDKAVVTSGIYERVLEISGKTYHHIFDSKTGYPIDNDIASVTIISEDAIDGEIWTKILFKMDITEAISLINSVKEIETIIVDRNDKLFYSQGLEKNIVIIKK